MAEQMTSRRRDARGRHYGKYRGVVVDNRDPRQIGRVRVAVQSLLGDEETGWALPCVPFGGLDRQGMFFIPENGSPVWVEFEEGDLERPIWTGTFWADRHDVPDEAAKPEPTTRVLQTPSGHRLQFDDTNEQERIRLIHVNGAALSIEHDGSIELTNSAGMTLNLSNERSELLLEDGKGNTLRMTDAGLTAEDLSGNAIQMDDDGITIRGTRVTIDAPGVAIGGESHEPVIRGTSFLAHYATHTHTVAPVVGGPTSPPVPQGEAEDLSTVVTSG